MCVSAVCVQLESVQGVCTDFLLAVHALDKNSLLGDCAALTSSSKLFAANCCAQQYSDTVQWCSVCAVECKQSVLHTPCLQVNPSIASFKCGPVCCSCCRAFASVFASVLHNAAHQQIAV